MNWKGTENVFGVVPHTTIVLPWKQKKKRYERIKSDRNLEFFN